MNMLNKKEVEYLRKELATAKNPFIFYDDDPDGLCSFLLLYRIHREGKGIIVKSAPKLDERFVRKVKELNPDKIFVLDVPIVMQEFIDQANKPIFWIDHHQPLERTKIHYYNPRIKDSKIYLPTTRMIYQLNERKEDLWIAMVGCLGDYHLPDFVDEFSEKYPKLVSEKKDLPNLIYKSPIGKLVRIFDFLLKGPSYDVHKSIKILTRIKYPEEILQQETAQGKFLYKRFEKINMKYEALISEAKKQVTKSKLLLFYYNEKQWSFTASLANELSTLYPQKVILIARNKSGEMKCSLRAKTPISGALEKALVGINGYGGGHENACGAVINEENWDLFLENFKTELK